MKAFICFFSLLFCLICFSQATNNQEKIKNLLETYFEQDREIIHVQFNKTLYLNNEDLAFKGYVISKNTNLPHPNTSNVQLIIYDEQEKIVQKQLLYTSNGTFSGGIHLNEKFKTGKYLFHFYTNWMNNFKEDDSFSQTIEIYNIEEPFSFKTNEPHLKTVKIDFFPEGGSIINGISNIIGVKITDCNDRGLELTNILIFDSKSNKVSRFSTNKMGHGVLYLIADINEKYTLKTESKGQTIVQELPPVKQTGIAVGYNNNLSNNKLAIIVKTNEKGVELNQNKKFNLLIQQNSYSVQKEINFDNQQKEQVLFIDKKYLQNGVNSIRLIDENMNEITERLIYIYATTQPQINLTTKNGDNDTIILSSVSSLTKANLSTSILPEKNIGVDKKRSILGTYYLNTYLENPEIDNYSYFDLENKDRKRDMDYLMLNQTRSKLLWENVKSNPPVIKFKFDTGVTIGGTVDSKTNQNIRRTVSIASIKDNIFEKVIVQKDNTFKLENYFVKDSTVFILQLANVKNDTLFSKIVAQVVDNQTKFNLPLKFSKNVCPVEKASRDSPMVLESKINKKIINLDEVSVKQKKKSVFIHDTGISHTTKKFKIDQFEFGTILDFIGRNGFRAFVKDNKAFIRSTRIGFTPLLETDETNRKRARDGTSEGTPEVLLDGYPLAFEEFIFLQQLYMSSVDEIYIDRNSMASTRKDAVGLIRIFLKRGEENSTYPSKCSSMIAKGGFSKNIEFKNSSFDNPIAFNLFGTLYWSPSTTINENQSFEYKFPKGNQKVIQVFIEGFSEDGQLISEMYNVTLE